MRTKILSTTRISALSKLDRFLSGDDYRSARFFIVVDENTYNCCLPTLIARIEALQQAEFFEVPVGEEAKSLEVAAQLWSALMESGADRSSVIVTLGGGCISDIGGFVAAGYRRGIRYINVPTTLIGMVDAAIGGKTAVNLADTKNQVGFFHLPEAVCIHPDFLSTLPDKEWRCGICEMLKTFLLSDQDALTLLQSAVVERQKHTPSAILAPLCQCVDFKSAVVNADPNERSLRRILNLGHTFGHAIEAFMLERQSPMPHGLAVGVGLVAELYLSCKKLGLNESVLADYLRAAKCLVAIPQFSLKDAEAMLAYMRADKKNVDGLILCTLIQDVGVPVIDVAIDDNEVRDALLKIGKL